MAEKKMNINLLTYKLRKYQSRETARPELIMGSKIR